ncbi:uncharacterized protein EV422DRAFT_75546 [Fimicolochytrium jonesii]|uniref:uncharacterized protein n=1 Tax=Fimicolochytrium jonesii TaxID=1396493 RepID=UPI0022FE82DA|nr:uncharacterized protein EV422DRAFT_75546 [Fimicolochytrium jonesii]KAI8820552.1 hypothetical protein EV422DRAFT_75546 [Fimicolochytrium jonesii]
MRGIIGTIIKTNMPKRKRTLVPPLVLGQLTYSRYWQDIPPAQYDPITYARFRIGTEPYKVHTERSIVQSFKRNVGILSRGLGAFSHRKSAEKILNKSNLSRNPFWSGCHLFFWNETPSTPHAGHSGSCRSPCWPLGHAGTIGNSGQDLPSESPRSLTVLFRVLHACYQSGSRPRNCVGHSGSCRSLCWPSGTQGSPVLFKGQEA